MIDFVYCRLKKTHNTYTKKTLFTHRKELFTGVYVSLVAISMLGRVRKRQNKLFTKSNKMPIIMLWNGMTLKDTTKYFSACVSIAF